MTISENSQYLFDRKTLLLCFRSFFKITHCFQLCGVNSFWNSHQRRGDVIGSAVLSEVPHTWVWRYSLCLA